MRFPYRLTAALAASFIINSTPLGLPNLLAQTVTETKIQLMADAFRARNDGDFVTARD